MTTRFIETKGDIDALAALLRARKLPLTVTVRQGKHRSTDHNRLQRLWHAEAAEQLKDETAEDKRAYCKLHFAVPILRNEDDHFCAAYDKHIRQLDYETKLAMMRVPLDFPVTRLMTSGQHQRYMEAIEQHYRGLGVELTIPEAP